MYIDLVEEMLGQVISCPKAFLEFIMAIIPRLNEHYKGGASYAENHTNDGRYLLSFPLSLNFNSFFFLFHFLLIPLPIMSDQSRRQSKRLKARKTDFKPYLK